MGSLYQATNNAAADSEAVAISASADVATARDEGQSLSGAGAIGKNDAIVLGGTNNRNNLGGEYTVGNNSTLTINAAAGAEAIADKFTTALADINASSAEQREGVNNIISDALGKISELSESKQTDGISAIGKVWLWGIVAAVAGLLIWKWNK
jgi:hypothetical protein